MLLRFPNGCCGALAVWPAAWSSSRSQPLLRLTVVGSLQGVSHLAITEASTDSSGSESDDDSPGADGDLGVLRWTFHDIVGATSLRL